VQAGSVAEPQTEKENKNSENKKIFLQNHLIYENICGKIESTNDFSVFGGKKWIALI
jgi:hypothetical protein